MMVPTACDSMQGPARWRGQTLKAKSPKPPPRWKPSCAPSPDWNLVHRKVKTLDQGRPALQFCIHVLCELVRGAPSRLHAHSGKALAHFFAIWRFHNRFRQLLLNVGGDTCRSDKPNPARPLNTAVTQFRHGRQIGQEA